MKKAIVGIGLPGSGKTTFLKAFAERNNYVYISPDEIREELTSGAIDQSQNKEAWQEAYRRCAESLEKGTVVLDSTMAKLEDRREALVFLRNHGAEHIQGVYCDPPFSVALQRNSDREHVVPGHTMARMKRLLTETPPELEDGFDSLFTFDEHGELVKVLRGENREITKEFGKFY